MIPFDAATYSSTINLLGAASQAGVKDTLDLNEDVEGGRWVYTRRLASWNPLAIRKLNL